MMSRPRGTLLPAAAEWLAHADAVRKTKGLTKGKLAEKAGVSPAAVTDLFKGRYDTSRTARLVAEALEIEPPATITEFTGAAQGFIGTPAEIAEWISIAAEAHTRGPDAVSRAKAAARKELQRRPRKSK